MFSIPVGIVYRPNESKVRNVKAKDYLGKARLVAASDRANAFTGFAGSEVKKMVRSDIPIIHGIFSNEEKYSNKAKKGQRMTAQRQTYLSLLLTS